MDERAMARLDALTAPPGQELLCRLAGIEVTAAGELGLAEALRREYPAELVTAALAQHELRCRARGKFGRAGRMYFTRDGLEQSSAEPLARHRATRYAGATRVADLCTGIGGDLVGLAAAHHVVQVLAVDRDPVHLRMAALNAAAYEVGAAVRAVCTDVREADLAGMEAVFVDPARRAGGRRLRTGESEPPLSWCTELAERVAAVGIKAAPGLDRARVPAGWEVEFVADGRDLKEAVLWSPALAGASTRATVLNAGGRATPPAPSTNCGRATLPAPSTAVDELLPEPGDSVRCGPPGEFLLDPNPAVTRAGLVEDLARRIGAWKIDPRIAFLASDRQPRTPFGRTLRVLDSGPWREKDLAGRLRALDIGALDIRRRGLAGDVDALRRRLGPAGSRPGTLVMTRVDDRPWALICAALDPTQHRGGAVR